jgi:hypothetical protein
VGIDTNELLRSGKRPGRVMLSLLLARLSEVQRRRERLTQIIQRFQRVMQQRGLGETLEAAVQHAAAAANCLANPGASRSATARHGIRGAQSETRATRGIRLLKYGLVRAAMGQPHLPETHRALRTVSTCRRQAGTAGMFLFPCAPHRGKTPPTEGNRFRRAVRDRRPIRPSSSRRPRHPRIRGGSVPRRRCTPRCRRRST